MIYQTDSIFPTNFNKNGCYFFSILHLVNLEKNSALYQLVYNYALQNKYLNKDLFIYNPEGIVEIANAIDHNSKQLKFLGIMPTTFEFKPEHKIIQCWFNKANNFRHFVVGKDGKNVEYDPIRYPNGSGSLTVKNGVIESYRVFYDKNKT